MRKIFKFSLIVIIIAAIAVSIKYYIVNAYDKESEEIVYEEEVIEEVAEPEIEDSYIELQIEEEDEIVEEKLEIQNQKYITEHQTPSGEKYTIIGSITIPKINLQYDILSSTSVELLKISLNKYWGANPNEVGNMCILGHNWFDARFFGKLHLLEINDVIEITDCYDRTEEYHVYDKFVVEPEDTSCTSQMTNGEKEITLITCYNNGQQRLAVKARAINN